MTSLTSAPPAPPAATPTVAGLLSRLGPPGRRCRPGVADPGAAGGGRLGHPAGIPDAQGRRLEIHAFGAAARRLVRAPRGGRGRRVSPAAIDRSSIDASIARMVFVNGFFAPHLSTLTGLPAGVTVTNLASALAGGGVGLEPFFSPGPANMATPSMRSTPPWPRTARSFASRPARSSRGSSSCSSIPTAMEHRSCPTRGR